MDSLVKLYVDDVLMYRSINDVSDHQMLQDDLNKLVHWSTIWLMPFNLNKCEHLIHVITNKFSPSVYNYKLNDHTIQRVQAAKYLGLTISHSLSWFTHISGIIGQVTSALAFFRRNFGQCSRDVKIKCYLTYIHPIIEYAAIIWSPYLLTKIHQIEMVQRKAVRFVFNDYSRHSSVTDMLNQINWQSLEKRRDDLNLLMFYKIINQYVDVLCDHILQNNFTYSGNRKFLHLPSRIDSFKHSFFPRAIRLWNHLPEHIVKSDVNIDSFKHLLSNSIAT